MELITGAITGGIGGFITGTLGGGTIGAVAGSLAGTVIGEMLSPTPISEESDKPRDVIRRPIPQPDAPC